MCDPLPTLLERELRLSGCAQCAAPYVRIRRNLERQHLVRRERERAARSATGRVETWTPAKSCVGGTLGFEPSRLPWFAPVRVVSTAHLTVEQQAVGGGGTGCVNTVAWSPAEVDVAWLGASRNGWSGTTGGGGARLLTAGDDRCVACWDMVHRGGESEEVAMRSPISLSSSKLLYSFNTGHVHNVFQAAWKPGGAGPAEGGEEIVTCAGDGGVRVHHVERATANATSTTLIHGGVAWGMPAPIVHGFDFLPTNSNVVYAACGQGRVLMADMRQRPAGRPQEPAPTSTLLGRRRDLDDAPDRGSMAEPKAVKVVRFPPKETLETSRLRHEYHLVVARDDLQVLVYDVRNLSPIRSWSAAFDGHKDLFTSSSYLAILQPSSLHSYSAGHFGGGGNSTPQVSDLCFNKHGTELLVSYQFDSLYTFQLLASNEDWCKGANVFECESEDHTDGDDDLDNDDDDEDEDEDEDDVDGCKEENDEDLVEEKASEVAGAVVGPRRGRWRTRNAALLHHSSVFVGALNAQTFLKTAKFFGPNDEYIVCGSDTGKAFVFDRFTSRIVGLFDADDQICNGVVPHPTEPCFATYGISHAVRVFEYCSDSKSPTNGRGSLTCSLPRPLPETASPSTTSFSHLHHLSDQLMDTVKSQQMAVMQETGQAIQSDNNPEVPFRQWVLRIMCVHLRAFTPHLEPYLHFNRLCGTLSPLHCVPAANHHREGNAQHGCSQIVLPYPRRVAEVFRDMPPLDLPSIVVNYRQRLLERNDRSETNFMPEFRSRAVAGDGDGDGDVDGAEDAAAPADVSDANTREMYQRLCAQSPDGGPVAGVPYRVRGVGAATRGLRGEAVPNPDLEPPRNIVPLRLVSTFKAMGTYYLKHKPDDLRWALEFYLRAAQHVHPRRSHAPGEGPPFTPLPPNESAVRGGVTGIARQKLHIECLLNIAAVCLRLQRPVEAIVACDAVLQYDSNTVENAPRAKAFFRKGTALLAAQSTSLETLDEAVECLSNAVDLLPSDDRAVRRRLQEAKARRNKAQAKRARKLRAAFRSSDSSGSSSHNDTGVGDGGGEG